MLFATEESEIQRIQILRFPVERGETALTLRVTDRMFLALA